MKNFNIKLLYYNIKKYLHKIIYIFEFLLSVSQFLFLIMCTVSVLI